MIKRFKIWFATNWPHKAPNKWCDLAFNKHWSEQGIDPEKKREQMLNKIMDIFNNQEQNKDNNE